MVTIGELHEGVERADRDEAALFGVVSAAAGRKLSHNDKWILARAVLSGWRLVTEDTGLDAVARSPELARALTVLGTQPPEVTLALP